jgi:hypothetical protein
MANAIRKARSVVAIGAGVYRELAISAASLLPGRS